MEPPRRRLRTKVAPAALHAVIKKPLNTTLPQVSLGLLHIESSKVVLRYSGILGVVRVEGASKFFRQLCGADVLRVLCEDMGAYVRISLKNADWKKTCFVASMFPGEPWTMSTISAIANFINLGMEVIPAMPPHHMLLRVSSFRLSPYEMKHLI